MKCLVTGGAGFIGSHIVDRLVELGHEVAVLDSLRSGKEENLNSQVKFFRGDVRDAEFLKSTFSDFLPEVIFHLAAQNDVPTSMENPYEDQDINIVGMMRLMDAARDFGVKKVIYTNTGGAFYGDVEESHLPIKEDEPPLKPTSYYGVSKLCAEYYLRLYGNMYKIPWISLRYSNVYGPRQDGNKEAGVVAIFTTKLLNGEIPTINGDGSHTRDYIYVGDVVEANVKALDYESNTEDDPLDSYTRSGTIARTESPYFNIATGVEVSNLEVFETIAEELGKDIKPNFGLARAGDVLHVTLDPSKAEKILGFKAKIDFKEGVKLTIDYYKSKN